MVLEEVSGGKTPDRLAMGFDGLRSVQVAKAVYESGKAGKAITLPPRA